KWTAEAIYNILDTAVKYTPCGGTIQIATTVYSLFCRIDIKDTGIGIPEEEQAKVFARFYRSPAVSESEGVGIGLYLARQIIADEGGYIKVNSKVGGGTCFSVFLPIAR
ncbi:MAG: sensor histidine kinase, partial [Pygmaiobacter massiliensis]|nr:sensor histidine kinase [Pygmaiobacter massiliensis]